MIAPTVGRMVYYKSRGSADGVFPPTDRAAVITDVRGTPSDVQSPYQVRLAVFNPEGIFFSDWLWQGQEPGQWDWMPFQKDQVARPERPEALAGLHGDFVLILVDEASGVSDKVFEVMKGALHR